MLECSISKVSRWKVEHPSDTEDETLVRLSSEDEAEGLDAIPGVARWRSGGPAVVPGSPVHHPAAEDEVLVKKRALKWVKQQVLALLRGEDLPKGAQAREVAEVPYQIPAVARERKDCPVCQRSFKTHHCLMVHMGVHWGEKFPCGKCGKVLATKRTWTEHTKACVSGIRVGCPDCGQEFSCNQGMHQHQKAKHGAEAPTQVRGGYICPFCGKGYQIKKTWVEHKPYCASNPDCKGPYYCRVAGCPSANHPFTHMRNLNQHMANLHGWKEHHT